MPRGNRNLSSRGSMTVQEAGRLGGEKVSQDREHMSEIGQRGGARVRELIERGKSR